jgi:hypothetical protein
MRKRHWVPSVASLIDAVAASAANGWENLIPWESGYIGD